MSVAVPKPTPPKGDGLSSLRRARGVLLDAMLRRPTVIYGFLHVVCEVAQPDTVRGASELACNV